MMRLTPSSVRVRAGGWIHWWGSFGVHAALYLEHGAEFTQTAPGVWDARPSSVPLIYDPSGGFKNDARLDDVGDYEEPPFTRDNALGVVTARNTLSLMQDYRKASEKLGLTLEEYYFNTTPAEEFLIAQAIARVGDHGYLRCARSVSEVLSSSGVNTFSGIGTTQFPANLAIQLNGLLPGASFASAIRSKINSYLPF